MKYYVLKIQYFQKDAIRESKSSTSELAQKALFNAINVPMELERKLASLWKYLDKLSDVGNPNCISDIQVRKYFIIYSKYILTNNILQLGYIIERLFQSNNEFIFIKFRIQ